MCTKCRSNKWVQVVKIQRLTPVQHKKLLYEMHRAYNEKENSGEFYIERYPGWCEPKKIDEKKLKDPSNWALPFQFCKVIHPVENDIFDKVTRNSLFDQAGVRKLFVTYFIEECEPYTYAVEVFFSDSMALNSINFIWKTFGIEFCIKDSILDIYHSEMATYNEETSEELLREMTLKMTTQTMEMVEMINKNDWAIEQFPIGSLTKKQRSGLAPHKVKRLIHLTKNKNKVSSIKGGNIDYLHSFSVRGHWRQVKLIGKDRYNNYCVPGLTWINPHIRGEGDLIKKTRIIGYETNAL